MLATRLIGATAAAAQVFPIQYVGGRTFTSAGTTTNLQVSLTSLTGGLASEPAAGDLVIVYFGTGSTVNRDLVVNFYTEIAELYSNDTLDTNLAVAYRFMPDPANTTFILSGGSGSADDAVAVAVQVWRGVDTVTPLDVTSTTATGFNSVLCNPPAITPVTNDAVIVSGGAGAHAGGTQTFSSSDLTQFLSAGANDLNDATIGLGYYRWTSGSFNPAAFTYSGTNSGVNSWAAVTLALRPA